MMHLKVLPRNLGPAEGTPTPDTAPHDTAPSSGVLGSMARSYLPPITLAVAAGTAIAANAQPFSLPEGAESGRGGETKESLGSVDWFLSEHVSTEERLLCLNAIRTCGGQALPIYVAALRSSDPEAQRTAAHLLVKHSDSAAQIARSRLLDDLENPESEVRQRTATGLKVLYLRMPPSFPDYFDGDVASLRGNSDPEVREIGTSLYHAYGALLDDERLCQGGRECPDL